MTDNATERRTASTRDGRVLLQSWKEIAAYLHCSVATVQRWEKSEGLPVHRHLHNKLGSAYAFTGEIDRWQAQRSRVITAKPILAVLPFDNLTGRKNQEFLTDGLTEELITQLGRVYADRMGVIARTSAMTYKRTQKTIGQIGHELGADYVLEGSVRRRGRRLRIAVQLIDVSDQTHLWAEAYDGAIDKILDLQGDVARTAAEKIGIELPDAPHSSLPSRLEPSAYDLYLKARFHFYKLTAEHLQSAYDYLQLVLKKAPNYAPAHAALAGVWGMRGESGALPPRQAFPKACKAALRALALDPNSSEAHNALGYFYYAHEWNWAAAKREFEHAIALNYNFVDAHLLYWDCLMSMEQPEEAEGEIRLCLKLDPYNPLFHCFYGWHLLYVHRYDDAVAQLRRTLNADPYFEAAHLGLWGALYRKGMLKGAVLQAKEFFGIRGHSKMAEAMVQDYDAHGYENAMRRAADKLAHCSRKAYVGALRIARLYAHGGDADQAIHWLHQAAEERAPGMAHLGTGWDWDELRNDPRFQNLLRRVQNGH